MNKNEKKITSWRKSYQLFAVLMFSLLLAACDSNSNSDSESVSYEETVSVELNAEQVVPTNTSTATASGELIVDSESGALSGSLLVNGMITTTAYIQEGKAGSNGDFVIALDVDGTTVSVPEDTVLTDTQIDSILAADFYVNLHSAEFSEGEIRGQILPSNIDVFAFELEGRNEVPPIVGAGTGKAFITLDRSSSIISINVATDTTNSVAAVYLQSGFAGENGDVLLTLTQDTTDTSLFSVSQSVDQDDIDTVDAGGAYINVITEQYLEGEFRAQALPEGLTVYSAVLSGTQEVTSVNTVGSGRGYLTLNSNDNLATAVIILKNLDTVTSASVNSGATGATGDALFELVEDDDDSDVWSVSDASVSDDEISNIAAGNSYFNVFTSDNVDGEIRGQISAD